MIRRILDKNGIFIRYKYQGMHYLNLTIQDLQYLLVYTGTISDKEENIFRARLKQLQDWRVARNTKEDFILTFGKYRDFYTSEVPQDYLGYLTKDGKKWLTYEEQDNVEILYKRRQNKLSTQLPNIYKATVIDWTNHPSNSTK